MGVVAPKLSDNWAAWLPESVALKTHSAAKEIEIALRPDSTNDAMFSFYSHPPGVASGIFDETLQNGRKHGDRFIHK